MKLKIFAVLLLLTVNAYSQELLDKIVAVVDNEIILQSELQFKTNLYASQNKLDPEQPGLKQQMLNSMIEEKLVYAQANLDSIEVTDEEISQRIDYQVNLFIQQYGSKERVEQIYGMSLEKIKRELRDDVRKSVMIQKLQEKKFGDVQATRREVEDFFVKFKDSLGVIPEKVKLAHILKNPIATEATKEKYRQFAQAILDSIKQGAVFATMAKKYSEDPGSAAEGGDLGFVKRGVFYPEFEAAAFALQPGELSEVIESPVGFHIIQMLEKRGESIHTRHILIKVKKSDEADLKAIEFLTEIRDSVIKGLRNFSDYAKEYSDDKETSPFGGELGTFYINQLDKPLTETVSKLKDREISFPKRIDFGGGNYGYHIVNLLKRTPQHLVDFNEDFNELQRLTDQYKKQELYENWIADLKTKIYWKINL